MFGSGLAVVPFLYGGVVQGHHWLTEHQFVDAVAVAMITPGPVVITVAFIGYLVAGVAGKETTERGEGWASPPVFNRTVALKDTWAKVEKKQTPRG